MNLDVGCGPMRWRGWVGLDAWAGVRPNVVADLKRLPFQDLAFERAYAGHVIEHFFPEDAAVVLRELRRCCRSLAVVWPDEEKTRRAEHAGAITYEYLVQSLVGQRQWPGDEHRWLPTPTDLLRLAWALGWRDASETTPAALSAEGYPVRRPTDPLQHAVCLS